MPYDMPTGRDRWTDNPFVPGTHDMRKILNPDKWLPGMSHASAEIASLAAMMQPFEAENLARWAKIHPTADPRTYVPLAKYGIDPMSPEALAAVNQDVINSVGSGQYGLTSGTPADATPTPTSNPTTPAPEPAEEDDDGGFLGFAGDVVGSVWRNTTGRLLGDDPMQASLPGAVKTVWRAELTGLASAYQGITVGVPRTVGGSMSKRSELTDKAAERYGLDTDTAELLRNNGRFWEAARFDPEMLDADQLARAKEAAGFIDERMQRYDKNKPSILDQTEAGQVINSYTDDQPGNLLTGRPEDGSVYDPKSGIWYNPKTKQPANFVTETGILPSQYAATQSNWAAVKVWDITTAEERANGVAPTAWTWGRGTAHIWWSPDETAFQVVSGGVDIGVNIFGDPMNLIPAGKLGSMFRGVTSGGRALMAAGDDVVVLTRGARVAGKMVKPSPASLVRNAGKGDDAARLIGEGADVALDPYLAEKGADIIPQGAGVAPKVGRTVTTDVTDEVTGVVNQTTGQVLLPHARYVVNKNAWQWLQTGRGARIVEELAKITSPTRIIERSNGKFDANLALRLADATSPEEVRAILGTRMGIDITRMSEWGALGGRGQSISRLPLVGQPLARQFGIAGKELPGGAGLVSRRARTRRAENWREFGALGGVRSLYRGGFRFGPRSGGGFDLRSADETYQETRAFIDGARMWDDPMRDRVDELLRATNQGERYNMIYGTTKSTKGSILGEVQRRLSEEFGLPDNVAHRVTRSFAGGLNPAERRYVNSGLGTAGFGAKSSEIGDAMLINEMMAESAMLPNYRTMRRATGILSKIYKLPDPKKAEFMLDGMNGVTSIWRSATLIRGAYVLREIGEMAFAMSLAGWEGMFTHPFKFITNAVMSAAGLEFTTGPARMFQRLITSPGQTGQYVLDRAGRLRIAYGGKKALTSLDDFVAARTLEMKADGLDAFADPSVRALNRAVRDVEIESGSGAHAFRDLTRAERVQVAKEINRDALRDYLLTQRGFRSLMPAFSPEWARVNGLSMFEETNALTRGAPSDQVTLPPGQRELNITSGYLGVDEPAARAADRLTTAVLRDAPETRRAYASAHVATRLMPLMQDQTMKKLADENLTFDEVLEWWMGTPTQELQFSMRPDLMEPHVPGSMRPTEESAREYLYGYQQVLSHLTGDDPQLLLAVKTGKFDGEIISTKNRGLVDYITKQLDEDDQFRTRLPEANYSLPDRFGSRELSDSVRSGANWFFQMTGEFSDIFGRAPLMRQAYTQRVLDLAKHMTHEAKWNAVRNLREAGDYKLAKKIAKVKTSKTATLGIEEVEIVAQTYARKQMQKIFYNAHKRQNWALAMRVAAPFAQATMNTFKRWGMFSFAHPQMLYRTTKPIEALTDPDSAVIYEVLGGLFGDDQLKSLYTPGRPDLSVDGFFFHNEFGDRLFAYPAIGKLSEHIPFFDAPPGIMSAAPWQNLNVAGTSFSPGLGPLLTWPAAMVSGDTYYKDSPAGTFLRWLAPYGLPNDSNLLLRSLRSFMPSALNRAFPKEDQQGTLLIDLYQAEMNSGDYNPALVADRRRAMEQAKEALYGLNFLGALGGSFTPATFSWERVVNTAEGSAPGEAKPAIQMMILQSKLATEFDKYTEPITEETAWEDYKRGMYQFYLDYGRSALMSVLPRTETAVDAPVSAVSDSVWEFRSDNPGTYNKFRGVIPLFFPGGDPYGEFTEGSRLMYGWQKQSGERYVPSVEDWARDADSQIGWMLYGVQYAELTKRVPDEEERSPLRAELVDSIKEKFPGWNIERRTSDFAGTIGELSEAVQDEDLQGLPGTKYLAQYLEARDRAIGELRWGMGTSGDLTTDEAAPVRAQLFTVASDLVRQDTSGTFAYAWARFLSSEFEED